MPKVYKIVGPPGCGKTEYLMRQVENACNKYFSKQIGYVSFTVASVTEAKDRIKKKLNAGWKDIPNVRTIHSHCFNLLGTKKEDVMETAKNIREFNENYPAFQISGGRADEDGKDFEGNDGLFSQMQILRSRLIPTEEWPTECQHFGNAWFEHMGNEGKIDFNGMLEQCIESKLSPDIKILMVDESQDLPALQIALIRQWSEQCDSVLWAGDGNQCQPPGSLILTRNGYRKIEDIEPGVDELISYAKKDTYFYGATKGYNFTKAVRQYSGPMYKIYVGEREASSTKNHIWQVRWKKQARAQTVNVVYMMQRGSFFRIGWCQLFNSVGRLHLRVRQTIEKAEKTWILGVFNDKSEASIMESYYAAQYGLPTITFEGINNSNHYTQQKIDKFFSMLDKSEHFMRATKLLDDLNLNYQYSFTQAIAKKNSASSCIFKVRSCNLLPGLMEVPVYKGTRAVEWETIGKIERKKYSGPVYSLDVEKYHTYITDGIATHNCIFRFAGSDPNNFINLKADKTIPLTQSYRLSPAILAKSLEIIKMANIKELVDFKPTDKYGPGQVIAARQPDLSLPGSHMILCRCNYQIKPYIAALRKANVPFCNQYRKEEKKWNPLGLDGAESIRVYLRLLNGESLDIYQIKKMVKNCVAKECMVRGTKKKIEGLPLTEKKKYEFFGLLNMGFLGSFLDKKGMVEEYFKLKSENSDLIYHLANNKPEQFFETPRVCVGTFHSTKGAEASHVWLDTGITTRIKKAINSDPDAWDDECRVAYVACTRAKKTLGLIRGKGFQNPFLQI